MLLPKVNWFTHFSLALEPFSGHLGVFGRTPEGASLFFHWKLLIIQNVGRAPAGAGAIAKASFLFCRATIRSPMMYQNYSEQMLPNNIIDRWKKKDVPESDARPAQSSKNSLIKRGGVSCELLSMTWISKVVIHQKWTHTDFRRWWPCSEAN